MTATVQLTDTEREILIQYQKSCLDNEKLSADEQRQIWKRMELLINGRSKARVQRMELEQGLSVTNNTQNLLREIG